MFPSCRGDLKSKACGAGSGDPRPGREWLESVFSVDDGGDGGKDSFPIKSSALPAFDSVK